MTLRRFLLGLVGLAALGALWVLPQWTASLPLSAQGAAGPLPAQLSDRQFWALTTQISEPNGSFRSENLVSNEHTFQYVIPALERRVRGGVYLGVAPDQNFTYIAAI